MANLSRKSPRWQVDYLYQAAMFGGILDDGKLKGKLDQRDAQVGIMLLNEFAFNFGIIAV